MQYVFGTGLLYAQPEGADTGATTPQQVGALRGVSVDMGFNAKDLHGGPWPLAIGRGTGKVACKAEFAQFTASGLNALFFGGAEPVAGSTRVEVEEAATITANAVTVAFAAGFDSDLGVVSSLPALTAYRRVAAAPGALQYTCNESTGVYGFGGSNGLPVLISYMHDDAANGRRIDIGNRSIGHTPRFSAVLSETFNGKKMTLTLASCTSSRLSMSSKMEDFMVPAFSFSAAADDAGLVGTLSVEEGANRSHPEISLLGVGESVKHLVVSYTDLTDRSAPGYDDSAWAYAPGEFSSGPLPYNTPVSQGNGVWVRKQVTINDLAQIRFTAQADDQFKCYWDGSLVFSGTISTPGSTLITPTSVGTHTIALWGKDDYGTGSPNAFYFSAHVEQVASS